MIGISCRKKLFYTFSSLSFSFNGAISPLVILMAHNKKQKVMDMYKHVRHPFHPSLPAVVNWIMDGWMVCRGLTTV